jgi:hypothetical protein
MLQPLAFALLPISEQKPGSPALGAIRHIDYYTKHARQKPTGQRQSFL